MTEKPPSPWRMNPTRIVILIFGALVLVYALSVLLGGPSNYQQLRDAAEDAKVEGQPDPAR